MKVRNQNVDLHESADSSKFFKGIQDPAVFQQQKLAYKKRKYDELLQEISFLDLHLRQEERRFDYPEDFKPFVFFFKFLARRPDIEVTNPLNKLKLWLPDTVLTSEGDNPPMWLYTGPDGYVYRTDNFNPKSITNKLGSFSSPDELVAVLKKPQARDFSYIGNDIRLLTLKDLSVVTQSFVSSRGDVICLQKYVKSIGPKAFVCRTCWKRDKGSYVWVLTNTKDYFTPDERVSESEKFIVNPRLMNSCTILKSIRGRYVDETTPYITNIVKFLENNISGAKFEEFVADFVKDESGTWWLVNIRGFVLVDKMSVNPKPFLAAPDEIDLPSNHKKRKPHTYQKVTMCKYCEQLYPVEELLHRMTLKSIIQADRHLIHRGKGFKWLERSEIKYLDTDAMCQEHKVCKSCYKLHQEIEKLREVEFEFARALGIPVNQDKRPDLVSVTGIASVDDGAYSILPKPDLTFSSAVMEEDQRALKSSKTTVKDETPASPKRNGQGRYMKKYRLMLYLHMIYDIPKDIDVNKNYYIEYYVLEQKQRYKIDLSSAFSVSGSILIPVNKLRVFYLFSYNRAMINEYINEQEVISLNLYCESEKLGTATFELKDFLSDKVMKREMFKVFSGKKLPILSWGLKVTVGLIEGELEDPKRIKPSEHKNIYIPSPEYFTCEPLPEEWLEIFEETQHHLTSLLSKSELKSSRYSINASRAESTKARTNQKSSFMKSSIMKAHTSAKELKARFEFLEVPNEQNYSTVSPGKSLFSDNNSISQVHTEKDNDNESLEIVRKILVDSIKDYEKGPTKYYKRPTSKKNPEANVSRNERLSKSAVRTWSAVLKPINE